MFPLNLVAYPGQPLNLHIFEPRYKQLINECLSSGTTFGIPAYINQQMEFGTEMRLVELTKRYPDGRMDIKTEGVDIFKVIDFHPVWSGKLYAGGEVEILQNYMEGEPDLRIKLIDLAKELFSWLGTEGMIKIDRWTTSYHLVSKLGLTPVQEYEFLQLLHEKERQYFLINHLEMMIPELQKAELARERIKQNGHFKHLDPLTF